MQCAPESLFLHGSLPRAAQGRARQCCTVDGLLAGQLLLRVEAVFYDQVDIAFIEQDRLQQDGIDLRVVVIVFGVKGRGFAADQLDR